MVAAAGGATAHTSYSGRDYMTDGSFDGVGTYTQSGQSVTSNFGWADGTDADYGDTHRLRAHRFTLTGTSNVTIGVTRQAGVSFTPHGSTIPIVADDDLIPAFSLYSGVFFTGPEFSPSYHDGSDHPDFIANHPGYPTSSSYYKGKEGPAEGAFLALDDVWFGNSLDQADQPGEVWQSNSIAYLGHAVDGAGVDNNGDGLIDVLGDGLADGAAFASYLLGAGSYTVWLGGVCYECQDNDPNGILDGRGYTTSLQVQPVPVPAALWLFGSGVASLGLMARRRYVRTC
jgi:hypothetical protein